MADRTMHPKPEPVILSQKVIDEITPEVCLDADHEILWEDDPAKFLAAYDTLGKYAEYVRLLMSGELTEAWQVLRTQKRIRERIDLLAGEIGAELIRGDDGKGKEARRRRQDAAEEIKRLRKRVKRLRRAHRDCSRFWKEHMEFDRDQEAAERLGLSGGEA